MKSLTSVTVALVIIFGLSVLPVFTPHVLAGTETLITTNTSGSDQQVPSISGDWILWEDGRNNGWDIYGYNIVTGEERRITPPGAFAHDPSVSGTHVVWQDYRNGNYDIFLYNLTTGTETRITAESADQSAPAVDADRIVWQDNRNGNYDIYGYNLSTKRETLISAGSPGTDKKFPAVSGDLVVWEDYREDPYKSDIFMNDTATGTVYNLTPGLLASSQRKPSISGTRVVWKDEQINTNGNIFVNDTLSGLTSRLDNGPNYAKKNRPGISGQRVIWIDNRNRPVYRFDIYMNDTVSGQNVRITADEADIEAWMDPNGYIIMGPSVSGNRIVWTDFRNDNRDIYLYTDGVTETCPVAGFSSSVQAGPVPMGVQFTDTSTPGSVPITHRHWEFGDGNVSTEQNPRFNYTIPGNYMVRLTVGNPYCRNETPVADSFNISVGSAPIAIFTASPSFGLAPLPVTFSDSSPGATAWNWSFGDGTYSKLKNVSHTFTNPGIYTVRLKARNQYGSSTASREIEVLDSISATADTTIYGIMVTTAGGRQSLIYDSVQLPGYNRTASALICTDPRLLQHGWQNITFLSNDGTGFTLSGGLIRGNISSVVLSTREIMLEELSLETGTGRSINFSTTLPSYPAGGSLHTQVWAGAIPSDLGEFRRLATLANYIPGPDFLAYTINITKSDFPAGPATVYFSANSSWVSREPDGRKRVFLERISDDRKSGEVMTARFLRSDTARNLDFFRTYSPRGFSTLGVSSLSGTGNPFQLITLTVTQHVEQPQSVNYPSVTGNDEAAGGAGPGKVPAATAPASTPVPVPAKDPGRSAKLYTNTNGTVTQATLLRSTDGLATIFLSEGTVATDAQGHPLSEITLTALPLESLPAVRPGSTVTYAGMAYDLGPDGSVFAPYCSFSLTPPGVRWGQDYTIRSFDATNGTWQDLPTAFNTTTGTITAQVSHLCTFALFSRPAQSAVPAVTAVTTVAGTPQLPAAPPAGAIGIFADMLEWIIVMISGNPVISIAIVILIIAAFLYRQGKFPGSGL